METLNGWYVCYASKDYSGIIGNKIGIHFTPSHLSHSGINILNILFLIIKYGIPTVNVHLIWQFES